jgi:hypothetical protein
MLSLAGTVRLPSPPPATADVSITTDGPPDGGRADIVLRITHKVSTRLYMTRLVRLCDVHAIFAVWPPEPAPSSKQRASKAKAGPAPAPGAPDVATYKTGRELAELCWEHLGTHPHRERWLERAVVYVSEFAPVVLEVEAALTAAESVAYYPPIVNDGTSHAARFLGAFAPDRIMDCHFHATEAEYPRDCKEKPDE